VQAATNQILRENTPQWREATPVISGKHKMLDPFREALGTRHYSRRTEQTYAHWAKRIIFFHNIRHPSEMAEVDINYFHTHLAAKEKVSASKQNRWTNPKTKKQGRHQFISS
jgi:hypothetical protein